MTRTDQHPHAQPEPSGDQEQRPTAENGAATENIEATGRQQVSPAAAAGETATADETPPDAVTAQQRIAELTADVQRLGAEYTNYRKRVERDRDTAVNEAKSAVAAELLPVLDDLERAQDHGDLTGPVKAIADKLIGVLQATGLDPFGQEGDRFDPAVHEAAHHEHSHDPEVTEPTVSAVLRRGYRFDGRLLRPALVAVTEPASGQQAGPDESITGGHQA